MEMKNFGPRFALAVLFSAPLLLAAQATMGKVHGMVSDPAGSPENAGTVSFFEGGMASPTAAPK